MADTRQDTLDVFNRFLQDLNVMKEGADIDKDEAGPKEMEKTDPASEAQGSEGKEQAARAKKSGSTTGEKTNTKDKARENQDEQGVKTLKVEDKVTDSSETIDKVVKLEQAMEQKTARRDTLRKGILELLDQDLEKQAEAEKEFEELSDDEQELLQKMALADEFARQQATPMFWQHLIGQLQRDEDRELLKTAGLDKATLNKFGGVDGLLDKLAEANMDNPEFFGLDEDTVAAVPEALPPEAAAAEAPAGEPAGDEEVVAMLQEAGVTPEQAEEALDMLEELTAQGYTMEQILAAITEELETAGAAEEAAADTAAAAVEPPAAEPPAEAPPEEELPADEEEQKVASDRRAGSRLKNLRTAIRRMKD